jgi:radical SAM protein with 4Fe4S-binding SPASM domain
MRHNEHEVLDAMELARSLGADAFTLKSYNPDFDSSYGEREASEYLVPERMDLRRFSPGPGPSPGRVRVWKNPCRNLWNNPSLHWDGHLCICTYDYNERYCQGSLRNRSFRSVWYGKSYHRIRRLFRKDWEAIPICRDCTYAFEGGSSIDETIRSATFFHDARRKAP